MLKYTVAILASFCCAAAFSEPFADWNKKGAWETLDENKTGHKFELIENYSKKMKNVGKLKVCPQKWYYGEISPVKRVLIAKTPEEFKGKFCFEAFADSIGHFTQITIRFSDSSGEIYQYVLRGAPFKEGQWRKFEVPFGVGETPTVIFGGDENKKIDYPVYFQALIFDGSRNYVEPLHYYIYNPEIKK